VYAIGKTFAFEAAHHLPGLPAGHKCARHHGHSYRVEVVITSSGPLSPPGFVTDFAELAPLGDHLAGAYDHRDLNAVLDVPPTSENLARTLFDWCAANLGLPGGVHLAAVRVSETNSSWAEYAARETW
jgi:6-pyruvoyltetrahydropterin/6-carboxytetrahydropterin synthase